MAAQCGNSFKMNVSHGLSQEHSGVCVAPVPVCSERFTQVVPLRLAAGDVVCQYWTSDVWSRAFVQSSGYTDNLCFPAHRHFCACVALDARVFSVQCSYCQITKNRVWNYQGSCLKQGSTWEGHGVRDSVVSLYGHTTLLLGTTFAVKALNTHKPLMLGICQQVDAKKLTLQKSCWGGFRLSFFRAAYLRLAFLRCIVLFSPCTSAVSSAKSLACEIMKSHMISICGLPLLAEENNS